MIKAVLVAIAVFVGGLVPLQGSINAALGTQLNNNLMAALISFLVGALFLLALTAGSGVMPSLASAAHLPKYLFLGGILGAIFIVANIILIPKVGLTSMILALVFGQIVFSLIVDHFGFFGLAQNEISFERLVGAGLVFLGVFFVNL